MRGSWRVARRSSFSGRAAASRRLFRCHWPTRPSIRSAAGRRGRCGGRTPRSCGEHFAQRDGVSVSIVPRMPRSGKPATNFSAKATSSRQACQASSTTAGSATACQSASDRSSDQYSGGASACAITRRNQLRSTSAMWRMRPSRNMVEGEHPPASELGRVEAGAFHLHRQPVGAQVVKQRRPLALQFRARSEPDRDLPVPPHRTSSVQRPSQALGPGFRRRVPARTTGRTGSDPGPGHRLAATASPRPNGAVSAPPAGPPSWTSAVQASGSSSPVSAAVTSTSTPVKWRGPRAAAGRRALRARRRSRVRRRPGPAVPTVSARRGVPAARPAAPAGRVVSEHHRVAIGDEDAVAEIAGPGLGWRCGRWP